MKTLVSLLSMFIVGVATAQTPVATPIASPVVVEATPAATTPVKKAKKHVKKHVIKVNKIKKEANVVITTTAMPIPTPIAPVSSPVK